MGEMKHFIVYLDLENPNIYDIFLAQAETKEEAIEKVVKFLNNRDNWDSNRVGDFVAFEQEVII